MRAQKRAFSIRHKHTNDQIHLSYALCKYSEPKVPTESCTKFCLWPNVLLPSNVSLEVKSTVYMKYN